MTESFQGTLIHFIGPISRSRESVDVSVSAAARQSRRHNNTFLGICGKNIVELVDEKDAQSISCSAAAVRAKWM